MRASVEQVEVNRDTARGWAIQLAHAERPGSEALTRAVGLAPSFRADRTAVVVRTQDMQRPIRRSDPDFFRFFDRHLTRHAGDRAGASSPPGSAASPTEAVRESLHRGVFSSADVAGQLGVSLRTLQRRLTAEDTSLTAIVEDVRRTRARSLLRAGMPVAEVAILLGYSDPTAFVRAFRRWFGTTPAAWRYAAHETGRAARARPRHGPDPKTLLPLVPAGDGLRRPRSAGSKSRMGRRRHSRL